MRETRKDCFEGLYNVNAHENVRVDVCDFDAARSDAYLEGRGVRVKGLKNGKAACNNEVRVAMDLC